MMLTVKCLKYHRTKKGKKQKNTKKGKIELKIKNTIIV
jgi:hypothetical protein